MDYLLKSSACMAAFYGLYFFGFRRLTFHALNRFYLLASLALSLTIPMINYEREEVVFLEPSPVNEASYSEENAPQKADNQMVVSNILPEKTEIFQVDWLKILSIIYLSGMAIMLLIFLKNIVIIIQQIASATLSDHASETSASLGYRTESDSLGYRSELKVIYYSASVLERSRRQRGNSSFFNYIFINPDNLNPHEESLIIAHERFHAQLFHTLDLLLLGILKAVFWFNPIIYFYQKSLKQIHEYEVDALMSATHDSREYAHLLLKLGIAPNTLIINQFSTKPLSDRIQFLFTKPTQNMKKLLYFLVIPIIGIGVMAFAQENLKVIYKEKILAKTNLEKPSLETKEITPKIKKEKLILDTLRKEKVSLIDSSKFTYEYGFPNSKFSLADVDSLKMSANNQFLVEGKDFIVKENKIFLDPKYKGSKTHLHIYSSGGSDGNLLYPQLAKLDAIPYPSFNKVKNMPVFVANKENSIYSYSKLPKLPTSFSTISRNQDTLRTILETNKFGKNPLVIINGEEYPSSILYRINPYKISSTRRAAPNNESMIKKYGEKARDGYIEIETRNLSELFLKNKITQQIAVDNVKKQLESPKKRVKRIILKNLDGKEYEKVSVMRLDEETENFSVNIAIGGKVVFIVDGKIVEENEIEKGKQVFVSGGCGEKIGNELISLFGESIRKFDAYFVLRTKHD